MSQLISVIMGIYNCATTLEDAVKCIQNQTYTNWELIMCDDGSSDSTYEIAKRMQAQDSKIILLKNEQNLGLNATLNRCLEYAKGSYIARMDGDDLCSPDRFEKEIGILEKNPEVSIVSTDMDFFDDKGIWGHTNVKVEPVAKDFLVQTQFCHAACMARKEAYDAVGGYSVDEKLLRVEDYHLWIKMYAAGFRGMNIKESLYQMRDDRNALKRKKFKFRINEAYVKAYAVKNLRLPISGYLYCLKPVFVGLIPSGIYRYLHRAIR